MGRDFWLCSLRTYFLLNLFLLKTVLGGGGGCSSTLAPHLLPKSHSVSERPRWPRGSWLW